MSVTTAEDPLAEVGVPHDLLTQVSEAAAAVDAGEAHPREVFPALAAAGLIDLGAPANTDGQLLRQAAVVEALAERSLSTAFALWGHRMSIEYLAAAGDDYAEGLLAQLRTGEVPGVSGMASAFKTYAGAGSLDLTVDRAEDGGLTLSGRLPWASNLYPDAVVLSAAYGPADELDAAGERKKLILAFRLSDEGVEVGRDLNLLALQGTASTSVKVEGVRLESQQILTEDFEEFMGRCRPTFAVLQSSFCLGLAAESFRQARANLPGLNEVFLEDFEQLGDDLGVAKEQLADFAARVAGENPPERREVLALRLESGRLAVALATLEVKTAGGKGFIADSAPNRRFREATFIPVQSPSEAQLRWELAKGK